MKYILGGIGIVIILFLAFAFGEWNLNPRYWDIANRGLFASLSLIVLVFSMVSTIARPE